MRQKDCGHQLDTSAHPPDQELQVLVQQSINVGFAHHLFGLISPLGFQIVQQLDHGLHIGNIAGKFSAVELQTGPLAEHEQKVQLG